MGTFAERLRAVMGNESFTPWAHRHGLSAVTVEGWVNKGRKPYPKTLARLVEATGIHEEWWLTGDGPPPLANVVSVESPAAHHIYMAQARATKEQVASTPRLSMAMATSMSDSSTQRAALDSGLLLQCLAACSAVYGDPFQAQPTAVQMEYAANLYNLLERMAEVAPAPAADPLRVFCCLEQSGLADLLHTFIKLGWARTFPPPDHASWVW